MSFAMSSTLAATEKELRYQVLLDLNEHLSSPTKLFVCSEKKLPQGTRGQQQKLHKFNMD